MTNPYVSQSITGYNSSPPSDDGSATASNEVKWDTIKEKLPDPVKVLAEGIDAAVSTAFDSQHLNAVNAQTTSYTVQASDRGKMITANGTFTIDLLAAATAGAGFEFTAKNIGSGTITIDGDGSETIDGAATFAIITQYNAITLQSDGTNWNTVGLNGQASNALLTDISNITPAQGDILYYDGANIVNLGPGTSGQFLKTQGAAADPVWAAAPLSSSFESAETTITANTLHTMAHGLGAFPLINLVSLKCSDAGGDIGYADNDELAASTITSGDDNALSVSADATNIYVTIGTSLSAANKSTTASAGMTLSKWKIVARAWV